MRIKSSEFDDVVEVHGSYLPILTCTVEGLFYLIFSLVFLLLWEFIVVFAHSVDWQKLIHIYWAGFSCI